MNVNREKSIEVLIYSFVVGFTQFVKFLVALTTRKELFDTNTSFTGWNGLNKSEYLYI